MSIWQILIIMFLSISGDLQPNSEVVLGAVGTPRIFLDVQTDGWIDLSVRSDEAAPANTVKLKVDGDALIFQGDLASSSVATPKDADGNTRLKVTDALAAAGAELKKYKSGLIVITATDGNTGIPKEIRVTRNDGNIVIGSSDAIVVQMPVTID